MLQSLEEGCEMLLMLTKPACCSRFEIADPFLQLFVFRCGLANLDKGTHNLNVHCGRSLAAQNAREHRNALLRERKWRVPTAAMSLT